MYNIPCYQCKSNLVESDALGKHPDFGIDIFSCPQCHLEQAFPIDQKIWDNYYQKSYRTGKPQESSFTDSYISFQRNRAQSQINYLSQKNNKQSFDECSALDIGGGISELLSEFVKRNGMKAVLSEIDQNFL